MGVRAKVDQTVAGGDPHLPRTRAQARKVNHAVELRSAVVRVEHGAVPGALDEEVDAVAHALVRMPGKEGGDRKRPIVDAVVDETPEHEAGDHAPMQDAPRPGRGCRGVGPGGARSRMRDKVLWGTGPGREADDLAGAILHLRHECELVVSKEREPALDGRKRQLGNPKVKDARIRLPWKNYKADTGEEVRIHRIDRKIGVPSAQTRASDPKLPGGKDQVPGFFAYEHHTVKQIKPTRKHISKVRSENVGRLE